MIRTAKGITANNRLVEISIFSPTISATINTKAKRNPPRPWFQLRLKLSGKAISANNIGLEIIAKPA